MSRNFIPISSFLHRDELIYVDVSQAFSRRIFEEKGLKVKFKLLINDEASRYYWVVCKIRSKDSKVFVESMRELSFKRYESGFRDYDEYCEKFRAFMHSDIPIEYRPPA